MIAAFIAFAAFAPAAPDTYALQWKFKEGDVFYNKTTINIDQTIEVMEQKVDQSITMKVIVKFKVKSVKEGTTVVEMTYLENSVDAKGLPGGNNADKLKGVSFTATMNAKLEITKLEGYDKFLDAVSDGDEAQRKLLKAIMPENTIRQSFGQTFTIAPEKPVAVDDKWNRTDKIALGPLGNVETKSALKLDSVKGDLATISVKGDVKFKAADGDGGGLPFQITAADLKADKFDGKHIFDTKIGRLTESKVEMTLSGTMTIKAAGQTVDAKLVQKMKTVSAITDKNPIVD